MKKKILCQIFGLAFIGATCSNVFATDYGPDGNITGIFSGADNVAGIFHNGAWFNPANCPLGQSDGAYLIEYSSTQNWNKVHAMLLSAYIGGKPIKIGVDPSKCFAGYPVIQRVAFVKGY